MAIDEIIRSNRDGLEAIPAPGTIRDAMPPIHINRKRIDYVFVGDPYQRRGRAGRILSASLAFNAPLTGVVASDHFGIVVDIVWPDRPT